MFNGIEDSCGASEKGPAAASGANARDLALRVLALADDLAAAQAEVTRGDDLSSEAKGRRKLRTVALGLVRLTVLWGPAAACAP